MCFWGDGGQHSVLTTRYVKSGIALSLKSSIPKYNNRKRLKQDTNNPFLLDINRDLCKIFLLLFSESKNPQIAESLPPLLMERAGGEEN